MRLWIIIVLLTSGLALLFTPIPYIIQEQVLCQPCDPTVPRSQCPKCPQKGDIEWKPSLVRMIWGRLSKFDQKGEVELTPTNGKKSCNYNGVVYKDGDGFEAGDGCNVCSCDDGRVPCTLIAC